jgi:hypothetical protein
MKKIKETSINELDMFCKKNDSFIVAKSGFFKGIASKKLK